MPPISRQRPEWSSCACSAPARSCGCCLRTAVRVSRGFALPPFFEPFSWLPRPDGASRSSGLGLCFVAEVALLHGGSASVANRDGGGATATLCRPPVWVRLH